MRGYLSPEPYLQKPWWVSASAQQGLATPTYAYGGNNPVRKIDPTGLFQLAPGSTCGNWPFAVALAKEWAGCKGVKANAPLNSCQTRLQSPSSAGCDICEFLAVSGGPTMYVRPMTFRGHTNCGSAYPTTPAHSEPDSSAIDQALCTGDGNIETLAWVLIDEASHWCASKTGAPVPDCYYSSDTNCAGTGAAKYCMSMGGR